MRDYVADYLTYLQVEKGLSRNSVAAYSSDLKVLQSWAGQREATPIELSATDLRAWLKFLRENGRSARSVARALTTARGFYKYLLIDEHLNADPCATISFPSFGKALPKYLSEEQIEGLFGVPDLATEKGLLNRTVLEVLYATGMRVTELVSLRRADFDLATGTVTCQGKGGKQRRIPLGKTAIEFVERWRGAKLKTREGASENRQIDKRLNGAKKQSGKRVGTKRNELKKSEAKKSEVEFMFGLNGKPLTRQYVWQMIKTCGKQIGVDDVSPHGLRHTFATQMLAHGADSRSVQLLLGHANLETTQLYTHITNERVRETYNRFHPRAVRHKTGDGLDS